MKKLLLILLLPMVSFSQKPSDNWISPVADVEFRDGKIFYYYSMDNCALVYINLQPVHFDKKLLSIKGVIGAGCAEDYRQMEKEAFDYIQNWQIASARHSDKLNYLKAVSLILIWNLNNTSYRLPENTLETLKNIQAEPFAELSQSATAVIKLYYQYTNE